MDWSWSPFAHRRVEADGAILEPGAVYHGGILLATSGGASTVEVYDGHDTTGDLIDAFSVVASAHERTVLERGITLRVGLYVNIGSNVGNFTVYFTPAPRGD